MKIADCSFLGIFLSLAGIIAEQMMVSTQFGQQQENIDVLRSANEVKDAMAKQLERHWEQHQHEMESLKMEVTQKDTSLEQLQL